MKRYKSSISIAAIMITLLTSCSDENRSSPNKDAAITVTVASASSQVNHVVEGSGQIIATKTALISTRVMGYITDIKVKPGDRVQRGQLLVTISNGDIVARRAQATAMVAESEAALRDAQKDLERYTELFNKQSASQKELENITLHYNSVKAKTEAARQMQNEAGAMLAYTNLTAPFSGIVTQKNLDAGSMASPGMPILVVEQTGDFQVITSVTEGDIDKIKLGAVVKLTVSSVDSVLHGNVSEISPSSQMSGGQYIVKIAILATDNNRLRSGMHAQVAIETPTSTGRGAVLVPAKAIIEKDQLSGLYTISGNNTALLRWVKLGKKQGEHVEVLSGLTADEKFILSAEGKLYNGAPVAVQ